jgi:hypothetical protein
MLRVSMLVCSISAFAFTFAALPSSDGSFRVSEAQAGEATASDCVGFLKTDVERGFEYQVSNVCSQKLACSVSWTLRCESNEGKVMSKKRVTERVSLSADSSASVSASADSCKQAWRIEDVGWKCDEAK